MHSEKQLGFLRLGYISETFFKIKTNKINNMLTDFKGKISKNDISIFKKIG